MLSADLIVPRARDNIAAQEVVFRTIQHILDGHEKESEMPPTPSAGVLART